MADPLTIAFACPRCRTPLEQASPEEMCCPKDKMRYHRVDGIWRMLLPEREPVFARFRQEYETVRQAEGRGATRPEYYRALPFHDLSGRMPGDWQIRAASFRALVDKVIAPLERQQSKQLRILDLGAGNGWLSNCLALRGHALAAVDLGTNDFDGLGCYRFYETAFIPVQAEFDTLPFVSETVDLVIFNASLHYAVDYAATLGEARRVLSPDGLLAVMDTPVYADPTSGARMVQERQAEFFKKDHFPSDALPSENFLTYQRVSELGDELGMRIQRITPSYGLKWQVRPLKARLLGMREPAKFHIIVFSHKGNG